MAYDNQSTYNKFGTGCSTDDKTSSGSCSSCGCNPSENCSCCPVGTVGVYNDEGEHVGCLSPNDAEIYNNGIIEPDNGYVKIIDPTTGKFLGNAPVSEAIQYLDYLENGTLPNSAQNIFNMITPEVGPSGFVELSLALAVGITGDIEFVVDRVGVTESILMEIINSVEDIQFDPSGLTRTINSTESELTTKFVWAGIVGPGVYTYTVRLSTTTQTIEIPFRLTLT